MKCREARRRVTEILLGELIEEKARLVEDHLRICEACRAEWEDTRFALGAIRSTSAETSDPGPDFWGSFPARVRQGIREERAPGVWERICACLGQPTVLVPAGALVALLVAVAMFALPPPPRSSGPVVARGTAGATESLVESFCLDLGCDAWLALDEDEEQEVTRTLGDLLDPGADFDDGAGTGEAPMLLAGGSFVVGADLEDSDWDEVDRAIRSEYQKDVGRGSADGADRTDSREG